MPHLDNQAIQKQLFHTPPPTNTLVASVWRLKNYDQLMKSYTNKGAASNFKIRQIAGKVRYFKLHQPTNTMVFV